MILPDVGVPLPFPRAARRRRRAPELPLALRLFAPSSSDSPSDSMETGGCCVDMESKGGAFSRKLARSDSKLSRPRSYGSICSTGTGAGCLLLAMEVMVVYGDPEVGDEAGCIARKTIRGSRRESGPR